MAEARQGAQQFSQISLACPSSREVVIEIKIKGFVSIFFTKTIN
jgi:hypothetical protein